MAAIVVTACTRTVQAPVAEPETTAPGTASLTTTAAPVGDPHAVPTYGVVATTERPLGAGELTCRPGTPPADPVEARSSAPGSPTVILELPDGFTPGPAPQGDVALNLAGPDGMTATVTIAPTTLDPAAAFANYADERTADYAISSVSVLPGELCDYSGQELMGTLADKPGQGIDYADRIVHVWTGAGDFLVAVALEAPNGTSAMDPARAVLLSDFGIRMP